MIRVEQVSKTYGSVPVLRQLCLTIPPGGKTAILGRSGSGKTTLLRLIAGLDRLDGGEIYLGDRRVSCPQHYLPPHQRGIGFVFQSPALWPHLTVQQNITFGLAHLSKTEQKQRLELLLEKLAIAP
ncbi:ATP-binding cassette domain-containing protein [Synechocystis sp. B12]|nr:ATP-binding cassette domain-containing protein [Synechocystis sp. B12]